MNDMPVMMADILAQALRTDRVETHMELARWSAGNALLVGGVISAVVLYAVFWMYHREARGHFGPRLRWIMISCRALVLVLLGVIGLEPVIVNYVYRRLNGQTIVLVDDSASMSLADSYRKPDDRARVARLLGAQSETKVARRDLEQRVLDDSKLGLLQGLAAKNEVRVFSFSDVVAERLSLTATSTRPATLSLSAAGNASDVGVALRSAIDAAGAMPVAGVVLLSDGQVNKGEATSALAEFLKHKGIPLYAVGVGDPAEPVNVSVAEVNGPRTVFKNDPFSVTVRVASSGIGREPIAVELLEERGLEGPKVVARKTLMPNRSLQVPLASFERKLSTPGTVNYSARVAPLADESVVADNQRRMIPGVQVLDDKIRVLLVAGAPSYDYRYLARLWERDKTVDVACWLQSADVHAVRDGDLQLKELPSEQKELFRYGAIVLLDCDPAALEPTWGSLVATFVSDHGGGVIYEAGRKYTGKFVKSPNTSALAALLPIVPDPEAELLLNDLGQYQLRSWPLIIPDTAMADPILRMSDLPEENRLTWSMLDGPFWHYPVRREKPVASVLMKHSNPKMVNSFGPHVLLATQYVGAGRSAFLGFDSTWRWRRGDEKAFNRFWMQLLRFVVEGRLTGGPSRCQVQTVRNEFVLGESVVVTVRALDEQYGPLGAPELELRIVEGAAPGIGAEARSVKLAPLSGRDGFYQGRFTADRLGTVRLQVSLPGTSAEGGAGAASSTHEILVVQPDLELRQTAMNRAALQQFAEATGGEYVDVDEVGRIPALIQDRSRTFVVRERPRPLWDNRWVLATLVVMLSLEWILRKKARLL